MENVSDGMTLLNSQTRAQQPTIEVRLHPPLARGGLRSQIFIEPNPNASTYYIYPSSKHNISCWPIIGIQIIIAKRTFDLSLSKRRCEHFASISSTLTAMINIRINISSVDRIVLDGHTSIQFCIRIYFHHDVSSICLQLFILQNIPVISYQNGSWNCFADQIKLRRYLQQVYEVRSA